jgi:hypothetical protein
MNKEAPMVKLKARHGRHRIPAKLIKIDGTRAYVVPKGHKHVIIVPLNRVSMWKSRIRNHAVAASGIEQAKIASKQSKGESHG